MAWYSCELLYRAEASLAVGYHPLGFVQRTRYYIPAWTLWGAVTATLTRAFAADMGEADYSSMGRFVQQNLPTSYGFIMVDGAPAYPHYQNARLYYGELPVAEFERRYLASYGQTAIAAEQLTAAEGTLHEREILAAYHAHAPVLWRIILYRRDPWQNPPQRLADLDGARVLAALSTLTVGSDRSSGLGWLVRENDPTWQEVAGDSWPRPVDWDGQVLRAHTQQDQLISDRVYGQLEPVVRRLWRLSNEDNERGWGPGQLLDQAKLLYTPGSVVQAEDWQPIAGPLGIWQTEEAEDAPSP